MIKSEQAYSPQNYIEAITGMCYILTSDTIQGLIEEIESCLDQYGYDSVWNYPLSEIDHIIENKIDVVLVELTGEDDVGEWKTVYRWFEVPKTFNAQS